MIVSGRPMRPMHAVPIVFAFDRAFAKPCAVAAISIALNSSWRHRFVCYCDAIEDDDARLFEIIRYRYDCTVDLRPVDPRDFAEWKPFDHIPRSAYYRLSAVEDLGAERCLYLDADVLVTTDIGPLLDLDLEGHMLGAARDVGGENTSVIPMEDRSRYFNSGVMLMNLPAVRSIGLLERFSLAYRRHEGLIRYADQCVLNHVLEDHVIHIDPRWNNLFNVAKGERRVSDFTIDGKPSILHYTGGVKPWMAWCSDAVSDHWLSYARLLGLGRDQILKTPKTLSEYLAMADKFEDAGDFRSSVAIKNKIIQHFTGAEDRGRHSSGSS